MTYEKSEVSIEKIKSVMKSILDNAFTVGELKVKLSTNPDQVDEAVDSKYFYRTCLTAAYYFRKKLIEQGIDVSVSRSLYDGRNIHTYLKIGDIIIDPTIGQFLEGHNHIFIGTREELRILVLSGKYQIINTQFPDPEEFFEQTWKK